MTKINPSTSSIKPRLVVAISGASGIPLALHFLKVLNELNIFEVHLIASQAARLTANYELDCPFSELETLTTEVHSIDSIDDSLASGTFKTAGMVILPCSMKTIAGIANGYATNLLLRAADVTIKEKRPLVLVARETPLSPIHLHNLETLASLPFVDIMPPMLSYYTRPRSIEEMEHHLIGKILDRFDVELADYKRWKEKG